MPIYHTKQSLESEIDPAFYDNQKGEIALSMPWKEACVLIERNHLGLASILESMEAAPAIRISDAQYTRDENEPSLSYVSIKILYNDEPWLTVDSRSDNKIRIISEIDNYIDGPNRVEIVSAYLTTLKNTQDTLTQTRKLDGFRGVAGPDYTLN